MFALVAMLLVATAGSARGVPHRVTAGTGHPAAGQPAGRHLDVQAPPQQDQPVHVPDLATPVPSAAPHRVDTTWTTVVAAPSTHVGAAGVTPTGRAPPAA